MRLALVFPLVEQQVTIDVDGCLGRDVPGEGLAALALDFEVDSGDPLNEFAVSLGELHVVHEACAGDSRVASLASFRGFGDVAGQLDFVCLKHC